jgi:TatD DNase family protein
LFHFKKLTKCKPLDGFIRKKYTPFPEQQKRKIIMELIDTHCHLYATVFSEDVDVVIQRAIAVGVNRFYLPAIDGETESALLNLEKRYPDICFAMQGLHPCSVKNDVQDALQHLEQSFSARRFAAVGEIGLDFYWDRSFEKEQYQAFHQQIEWAIHYDLPIVIHSRDSIEQTIEVVREHQEGKLRGIFHCFNEGEAEAKKIIELNFYIGIGGTVTYKNSKLPEALKNISLENIVIETDSPYLPPQPFRGKRNESSYLVYVAEKLAMLKGVSPEEVAAVTTKNALEIFGR